MSSIYIMQYIILKAFFWIERSNV